MSIGAGVNERQAIEVFHLLFLRALSARVDPALYVLKGGCNLRFFFKSIRYSEDIDLDVRTIAVPTLTKNVGAVLSAPAFARTLRSQRMTLRNVAAPKQTQTTQRWKVQIRLDDFAQDIPTKIEFSRRRFSPDLVYEPVDSEIINGYRLYPVLVQHYTMSAAFAQKIEALALRNETQARDLFDLKLLVDAGARGPVVESIQKILPAAIENAMSIHYDAFAGQVLVYLEPQYQAHYGSRKIWSQIQDEVIRTLETLQS